MKLVFNSLALTSLLLVTGCASNANDLIPSINDNVQLTAEEQRIEKAHLAMPGLPQYFDWQDFQVNWSKQTNYYQAKQLIEQLASDLWLHSKQQVQLGTEVDDRPLYWTRLEISAFVKQATNQLTSSQRLALVEVFENASRGRSDLTYQQATNKRILLTGFDPFLLDRNISQSNPSGLAALLLDGVVIEYQDVNGQRITAEINTAMVPVRFEDFDQGEIESLLAPFYATASVDLIATISMGRSDFDLEHFPGLRRSSTAPDNLNIYTGANKQKPLIPLLINKPLSDKEFVKFSLPYQAMQRAQGDYKVNDNREVTTLARTFSPSQLNQLADQVAVEGGGGGYLSNEISYRSILLRNKLSSTIPTGHIHTPRITGFDEHTNKAITAQIKAMLVEALTEI